MGGGGKVISFGSRFLYTVYSVLTTIEEGDVNASSGGLLCNLVFLWHTLYCTVWGLSFLLLLLFHILERNSRRLMSSFVRKGRNFPSLPLCPPRAQKKFCPSVYRTTRVGREKEDPIPFVRGIKLFFHFCCPAELNCTRYTRGHSLAVKLISPQKGKAPILLALSSPKAEVFLPAFPSFSVSALPFYAFF